MIDHTSDAIVIAATKTIAFYQKKAILGLEPKWYIIMTILDIYNRYTTRYNMQL